jgi:hypothetical protein
MVSRNGIYFWPVLCMTMMVKGTNRHLVIDPFLAFHQCLMLILLWALSVVVYSNKNLLEEPRMWQGSSKNGIYFWPILYMSMMVKGRTNHHLVMDTFLAFHQCLMLILLWTLLVVVYSNKNLLEEPRMWQLLQQAIHVYGRQLQLHLNLVT